MNSAFFTTRRVAPLAAAAALLAALGDTPAHALVASGTPFNGFFTTTVALNLLGATATGTGTSTNSPLGIVAESFTYTLTSFPDGNGNATFVGTNQFTDAAPAVAASNAETVSAVASFSTLFANVTGTININNYTGTGTDIFSPTSSTGKFAGATGSAAFTATVINQAAKTIKDQYSGFVVIPPAAVPETSSVVSLGILLMLGVGGVVLTARKKRIA